MKPQTADQFGIYVIFLDATVQALKKGELKQRKEFLLKEADETEAFLREEWKKLNLEERYQMAIRKLLWVVSSYKRFILMVCDGYPTALINNEYELLATRMAELIEFLNEEPKN